MCSTSIVKTPSLGVGCDSVRHVSVRDLRNNTSGVIAALEDGEGVVLTSRGREVGEIRPIGPKRRLVPAAELFAGPGDDPQLRADIAALRDATVDDIEDAARYDTSALIAGLRVSELIGVLVMSFAELQVGVLRARTTADRAVRLERLHRLEHLVAPFDVVAR